MKLARGLPRAMVRLCVTPDGHVLRLEWDGVVRGHVVDGEAGEVRFFELAGPLGHGIGVAIGRKPIQCARVSLCRRVG